MGYDDWEKLTQKNPLDILKADFHNGEKVRDVLKTRCLLEQNQSGSSTSKKHQSTNQLIQKAVSRVVGGVGSLLDPTNLAKSIEKAFKETMESSALQQDETVV